MAVKEKVIKINQVNVYRDPVISKLNSIRDLVDLLYSMNLIDEENLLFFDEKIDELLYEFDLTFIDVKNNLKARMFDENNINDY